MVCPTSWLYRPGIIPRQAEQGGLEVTNDHRSCNFLAVLTLSSKAIRWQFLFRDKTAIIRLHFRQED